MSDPKREDPFAHATDDLLREAITIANREIAVLEAAKRLALDTLTKREALRQEKSK